MLMVADDPASLRTEPFDGQFPQIGQKPLKKRLVCDMIDLRRTYPPSRIALDVGLHITPHHKKELCIQIVKFCFRPDASMI